MKSRLLQYLACHLCEGQLRLIATSRDNDDILEGTLTCAACMQEFPIVRGVPRFADLEKIHPEKAATAASFGFEWQHFTQHDENYGDQLLGWLAPVTPDFFKGKVVLDGGCGKGRHLHLAASWGATDVIGVDLSDAVDSAFAATRHTNNIHVIQADICHLPLRQSFDYAFSVGVLDHLPDPVAGFKSLASKLKPGGHLSVWVYGAENNGWIVKFVNPIREHFTSRISPRMLLHLSKVPTAFVYAASKLVYGPLSRSALGNALANKLFYSDSNLDFALWLARATHDSLRSSGGANGALRQPSGIRKVVASYRNRRDGNQLAQQKQLARLWPHRERNARRCLILK
jgi:SAM-dependent methyltransferase